MLTQSVNLFQPSDAEITSVLAQARNAHPDPYRTGMATRIDKAQDILLNGGLQLEPVGWQVRNVVRWQIQSQTHSHGSYIVPGSTNNCSCPDRTHKVGEVRFCKHSIAVSAYLRILRTRFQADVRTFDVELSMLHTGDLHAFAERLGHCQVRNVNGTYRFVDSASAVRFSIWQARKQAMAWLVGSIAEDMSEMMVTA